MLSHIKLIVGLGNPGPKYEHTRHNVGFWFADALAQLNGTQFRHEAKFFGDLCKLQIDNLEVLLLKPLTYMNRSGQSISSLAKFFKIPPNQILVVHDELDIQPGCLRLKSGGGHGGHNGLRDTIAQLGEGGFLRLRVGIGHPGSSRDVSNYVLTKPAPADREDIQEAIADAISVLPTIVQGELQKAMNRLHARKPRTAN